MPGRLVFGSFVENNTRTKDANLQNNNKALCQYLII